MAGRDVAMWAVAVAVEAVIGVIAYALLRRYLPRPESVPTPERVAELRRKYCWFDLGGLLPVFALVGVITWGLYELLRRRVDWLAARRGPLELQITPEPAALLLPALLLALILSTGPIWLLVRVLLRGQRYRDYVMYSRYSQGYDGLRVFVLLAALIVPAALGMAVLVTDYYTMATPTELIANPLWSWGERRRPLSDLTDVYEVRRFTTLIGREVKRPHHVARFRDGSTWSTRDGGRTPRSRDDGRVVAYMARQARVPIQNVDSLPGS